VKKVGYRRIKAGYGHKIKCYIEMLLAKKFEQAQKTNLKNFS
jgi:hypothetical protein